MPEIFAIGDWVTVKFHRNNGMIGQQGRITAIDYTWRELDGHERIFVRLAETGNTIICWAEWLEMLQAVML